MIFAKLDEHSQKLAEHDKKFDMIFAKLDEHSKQLKDINYRFDRLLFELKSDFNKI